MLFSGYAKDGGLYFPERIPKLSTSEMEEWSRLTYPQIVIVIVIVIVFVIVEQVDLPADRQEGDGGVHRRGGPSQAGPSQAGGAGLQVLQGP